jgi:hypothetical protein
MKKAIRFGQMAFNKNNLKNYFKSQVEVVTVVLVLV